MVYVISGNILKEKELEACPFALFHLSCLLDVNVILNSYLGLGSWDQRPQTAIINVEPQMLWCPTPALTVFLRTYL